MPTSPPTRPPGVDRRGALSDRMVARSAVRWACGPLAAAPPAPCGVLMALLTNRHAGPGAIQTRIRQFLV